MPRHYVVVRGSGGAEVIDATAFAKKKVISLCFSTFPVFAGRIKTPLQSRGD